jgi:hypothetical protein
MSVVNWSRAWNPATGTLQDDFENALRSAKEPFVVAFVGESGAGKSKRATDFVPGKHQRPAKGPHAIYAGPFAYNQLAKQHTGPLSPAESPDIFILDFDGFDPSKGDLGKQREMYMFSPH